jgi:hypothetical protein
MRCIPRSERACDTSDKTRAPVPELVARYYRQAIPIEVLAALRPGCPRALRGVSRRQTLSEVSFARLRIDAFPGIAWSTSMSDKLRYVLGRVIPSRELLDKREAIGSEAWAACGAWPQLSQGRRILRWALSRPARPPAMHTVRAALEDALIEAAPQQADAQDSGGASRML